MAINKRKLLQSAQKQLQKGALDRALKDYKTILEADPRDANVRLKVGDIFLRQGKSDEAVNAYLKVAQQFMSDGFDAKAVALFKQITKIDPKRHDVQLPLAELYQRLGLTSEAMNALQTAADAHHREGDKRAALEVLRKAATLDPSNTISRLKVAEMLRQEEMTGEAIDEYRACVAELERQGEIEGQVNVLEKLLEIAPDDPETLLGLGRCYVQLSKWSSAEEAAARLADVDGRCAVEACEILTEAYRGLRRDDALPEVYRRMADALRERGDVDAAREIMQLHVQAEGFSVESDEPSLDGSDESSLDDSDASVLETGSEDELLLDQDFGDDFDVDEASAPSLELDPEPVSPTAPTPAPAAAPTSTVIIDQLAPDEAPAPAADEPSDLEQRLAEASVYLRYGKNDRAAEALQGVLADGPTDVAILTRLAEGFEQCGDRATADRVFGDAATAAELAGDAAQATALRARTGAPATPAAAPGSTPAPASVSEIEIDVDLDLPALSEPSVATPDSATPALDLASADAAEFDFGDGLDDNTEPPVFEEAPGATSAIADEAADEAAADAAGGVEFEFGFDDEAEADSDPGTAMLPGETDPGVEIADDGLVDVDVDDLAASLSQPELAADVDLDIPVEDSPAVAIDTEALADADAVALAESDDDGDEIDVEAVTDPPVASPQRVAEQMDEAAFYFQQGLYDESEAIYQKIIDVAPSHPQALLRLGEIEAVRAAEPVAPAEAEAVAPVETADAVELPQAESSLDEITADLDVDVDVAGEAEAEADEEIVEPESPVAEAEAVAPDPSETGDFDLAKELSGAFHESRAGESDGTSGEGFEEVFAAFKQGVERQLGAEDTEARYDLGIAYKEMGLLDDAMNEFQVALAGPTRKLDCLHMMGLCALDLAQPAAAVAHFEQALALPDVPDTQLVALRFELGSAFQANGDIPKARECFEAVAASDPDFREVGDRLASLENGSAAIDGEFESFDDLNAEPVESDDAEEPAEAAATESYESFEDLMGDDDDDDDDDDDEDEPEPRSAEPVEVAQDVPVVPESEPEPVSLEPEPEPLPEDEADEAFFAAAPEADADLAEEPAAASSDEDTPAAAEPEPVETETPKSRKGRRKKISFV